MEIISFPLPHTLCLGADGSRLFTSRRSCLSLTVGELTVGRDAHRNQKIAKSGLRQTSDGGKLNIQMSSCSLFAFKTCLGHLIVSPEQNRCRDESREAALRLLVNMNFEKKAGNPEQTLLFTSAGGAVCKQRGSRFLQAGYQDSPLSAAPRANRATAISASQARLPALPNAAP